MIRPSLAARALLALVRVYQLFFSPLLGGHCRFEPSCSRYASACLETHGAWHGSLLSMLRLCKCHPFHAGGYDPPPAPRTPHFRARRPRTPQPRIRPKSPPSPATRAHSPS